MVKKFIVFVFSVVLFFSVCIPAFAYEPTGVTLTGKSIILASIDTGEVLFSKNPTQKVYPASITKIMTVTLMLESEKYNPENKVAMTEEALDLVLGTGSSVSNMKEGDAVTELDLAYLVLMASYGDCAYLAASYYGGSVENFVDMMNKKAEELGLSGTHYENPVGLHSKENYTTAEDTLKLTTYALKNETFKTICETTRYTIAATETTKERILSTTNFLQDNTTNYYYSYAKGVKTGYTDEAGRCLVSTASYNGYNYICVMFGCPVDPSFRHEFADSKNLYKWAFNNFEFKEAANDKNPICEIGVDLSLETDFMPLYIEKSFLTVLPKNADESTITIEPHLKLEKVDAPIKKGEVLGTADVIYAEEVIGTVNLVAGDSLKKSNLLFVLRLIKNFFISKYMIAVYILIALVIIGFFVLVYKMNRGNKKKRKIRYIPYDKDE